MAYDEGLAERLRDVLADSPGMTEKKMFGGLAIMISGNMAVGVIGDDLVVRLDPAGYEAALEEPGARMFDFTGRPMRGWVVVDAAAIDDDRDLEHWVRRGGEYAASLPAK
jgi:TfoX/Sxy family transcriptional regulator of competence genes